MARSSPHSMQHLQGRRLQSKGGPGWNEAKLMPLSCLLKGAMMSQTAAAAGLGEPESSHLLCVEGFGAEKQPILGKGP